MKRERESVGTIVECGSGEDEGRGGGEKKVI